MHQRPATHDLVLVGAGHTNMHIVRMFRMHPIPGVRLTVISPTGIAPYSGMLPGTLAGLYSPDDMVVDLYRAVEPSGMQLIVASATGLDPKKRRVYLQDRPPVRYDVCCVGIGSVPARRDLWARNERVLSIKPMATFLDRLDAQLGQLSGTEPIRVCIVGGGAAGTEVTFCLEAYLEKRGLSASVCLIDSGDEILSNYLPKTKQLAAREMSRRGIRVLTNRLVTDITASTLVFEDGEEEPADLVIWAAAAAPPEVLDQFALPKAEDGFLAVEKTLQSTDGSRVFVVGDTASFVQDPVPKAGVYAVREGPVLWDNIRRMLNNQPLVEYEPQSGFMSLLATGDGRAIGQYLGVSLHAGWVWKLKDYIDRRFMRMHQAYEPMDPSAMSVEDQEDSAPAMKCRGCGGKVGAGVLSAALERLRETGSQSVNLMEPDDAAIIDLTGGPSNIVSVDFFQAFLSDPFLVGRVAALNALSDIWAMGADPTGALAMVTLPEAAPGLQTETLFQLLAGGVYELDRAGADLLGGHTIESPEMTIGYTTLGRMPDTREPFRKSGVREGDRLILTRPLGTGTLLAGIGECLTRSEWMHSLLTHMLVSNQSAAAIARDFEIVAATDVTGFGLAGHLLEMLTASNLAASLHLDEIPLHDGFEELTAAGIRSTLYESNRDAAQNDGAARELPNAAAVHALFDPQTSGGLLLAVPPAKADEVLAALHQADCSRARIIGEAVAATDSTERLTVS